MVEIMGRNLPVLPPPPKRSLLHLYDVTLVRPSSYIPHWSSLLSTPGSLPIQSPLVSQL